MTVAAPCRGSRVILEDRSQELGINDLIAARSQTWRAGVIRWKEFAVVVAELAGLVASPIFLTWKGRSGDGHLVLGIPGYNGGGTHLIAIRTWLGGVGIC